MNNPDFEINLNNSTIGNEKANFEIELNGGTRGIQGPQGIQGPTGPQGPQGPQGNTGEAGYTPQKGIDYFTEEDIESLNIPSKTSDLNNDSGFITNTVNNLTNYTLKTNTGSLIDLEVNSSTYVVTLKLKDIDGNIISTDSIDLPLESVVVSGSFDSVNKKIVLTLQNGNTIDIPVGDLVAGLQTEITSSNKIASDYVDDSNSGNKFVSTSEKNTWNAKLDSSDLTDYVKNTDYATSNVGGVIKINSTYNYSIDNNGSIYPSGLNITEYNNANNRTFIGKYTLENVITGKGLTTKSYVDGLVGDINTALDSINGEVI